MEKYKVNPESVRELLDDWNANAISREDVITKGIGVRNEAVANIIDSAPNIATSYIDIYDILHEIRHILKCPLFGENALPLAITDHAKNIMQENQRLREALEFYADCKPGYILDDFHLNGDINNEIDIGKRAREALKESKGE